MSIWKPIILAASLSVLASGIAQAQQWDDAIQFLDANGTPNNGTTNVSIVGEGAACANGNSFPAFNVGSVAPCTSTQNGIAIDLNQFARQDDLLALQTQLADMSQVLQAQISEVSQALHTASVRANQGISMSLAMAGVPELQSDEHIAFSGNWGTFRGQNSGAVAVAYRLSDHVSVNAGFAGSFHGGTEGGRAGIRFGW